MRKEFKILFGGVILLMSFGFWFINSHELKEPKPKVEEPYGVSQSVSYVEAYEDIRYNIEHNIKENDINFLLTTEFYFSRSDNFYGSINSPDWVEYEKDYCKTIKEVDSLKCIRQIEAMELAKKLYNINHSVCK